MRPVVITYKIVIWVEVSSIIRVKGLRNTRLLRERERESKRVFSKGK